jgi:hypothetical protein
MTARSVPDPIVLQPALKRIKLFTSTMVCVVRGLLLAEAAGLY